MDLVDELLGGDVVARQKPDPNRFVGGVDTITGKSGTSEGQIDVLDDVLGGSHDPYASAGTQPVGSVFTETAPQKEGAGFGTQVKAAFLDDPETKIKVYAAARFPDLPETERLKRYGIHNGEVVYQADDGKLYRETPDTFMGNMKRGIAEGTVRLPTDLLTVLGAALGGPLGAGYGAATGEQVRKAGGRMLGEQQTVGENVTDMGIQAGLAAGGELGGRAVAGAINRAGAKRGGRVAVAAGRDRPKLKPVEIAKTEAEFRARGMEPFPPQTTESKALIDRWTLLEDMPRTADIMSEAKKSQGKQVQEAIETFLDEVGPDWTPTRAGEELTETARTSVKKLEKARTLQVRPLYRKAFETAPEIDISPVVNEIDEMLPKVKGTDTEAALKKVKGMLTDDSGNPITDLEEIDLKKKQIDKMLSGPEGASIVKDIKHRLGFLKEKMLRIADEASPEYKAARKKYKELSPAVEQRSKGLVGQIAKIEGDKVHTASKKLIDSAFSSPASVARARFAIRRKNPEAWDAAVRTYLSDIFEGIKTNVRGENPNIAGQFYKKVLGNEKQKKILWVAMGDKQFDNLETFGEVLRKVSRIYGKESTTAPRQIALAEMRKEGTSRAIGAAGLDISSPFKKVSELANDALFGRYQENLARALTDPAAAAQLKRMKQLNPRSQKFLRAFGAFLGIKTGQLKGDELPDVEVGELPKQ